MKRSPWILFVARRWFEPVGAVSRSFGPATAGIAVGVTALLTVIGIMNGFQSGFMDAVLDLDSYHLRIPLDDVQTRDSVNAALPDAVAIIEFSEVRTLLTNERSMSAAVRIKVVPDNVPDLDPAFSARLELRAGAFEGGLVIGSALARSLDLRPGDQVTLLDVRSSEEEGLSVSNRTMPVGGIYHSGHWDFDSSLAFMPASLAGQLMEGEPRIAGVRLGDRFADGKAMASLGAAGIKNAQSWREYNRAFFGALRMEKTIMMVLVGLIFLVVGVNIFHGMRKAVYHHMEDIATLKALGADAAAVRSVFLVDGFVVGAGGSLAGLVLGLLLTMNINGIFSALEMVAGAVAGLFGRSGYRFFSPDMFYIADVPVRLYFGETLFMVLAGTFAAVIASWLASNRVSSILSAEVLRDE